MRAAAVFLPLRRHAALICQDAMPLLLLERYATRHAPPPQATRRYAMMPMAYRYRHRLLHRHRLPPC